MDSSPHTPPTDHVTVRGKVSVLKIHVIDNFVAHSIARQD